MIKNAVIIIPNNSSTTQVCDYLEQTVKVLRQENKVFVIHYYSTQSLRLFLYSGIFKNKWDLFTPIQFLPLNRFNFIQRANKILYFFLLRWHFQRRYSQHYLFTWMFFPELIDSILLNQPKWKIIYDIVDFHYSPDKKEQGIKNIQKKCLLQKADYIFSISHALKNLYQEKTTTPIHVVPQGFDATSFAQNNIQTTLTFPNGKPIIGLVAQLSERLDLKLLHKLIKNNPQWNFVFIGPLHHEPNVALHFDKKKIEELFSYPNSFHYVSQPRNTILSILKKFDICMIPYDISFPFNKYCYPMKLFEYFYVGKPIISTPIKELKLFPRIVELAKTPKEWEMKINKLLSTTWSTHNKTLQKKLAIENSWKNKLSTISKYLQ